MPEETRSDRGGGVRLEELEGRATVVKAASVAHRTPIHYAERWFCELDGSLMVFVNHTTMAWSRMVRCLGPGSLIWGIQD